jgi:hypothetical protein
VTAIGTGGRRYAKAFIEDEDVPFPVLLDEEGTAAAIVGTGTIGVSTLLSPSQIASGFRSFASGHRQNKAGSRPMQLGATIVMGPGDEILYEDFEDHAGDHADLDEVIRALKP